MTATLVHLASGRLAIRTDGILLAVPMMAPGTPRDVKRRVFEYILRRQPALALQIAEGVLEEKTGPRERFDAMMAETPHHTSRTKAA
jgi:hypothetical protein